MVVRRAVYLFLPFIVLAGLGFYLANTVEELDESVSVPFNYEKINQQIRLASNAHRWLLPFSALDSTKLQISDSGTIRAGRFNSSITGVDPLRSEVNISDDGHEHKFLLEIEPDRKNPSNSKIFLHFKRTLFNKYFGRDIWYQRAIISLHNLGAYLSDTKNLYGYRVHKIKLVDTAFLFEKKIVDSNSRINSTKAMFAALIDASNKRNLGYSGVRIFHSEPASNGKLMIYGAIGITKRIFTPASDSVQFKGMPPGFILLVVDFNGRYGDVGKAYAALQQYILDHNTISMAMPFEKILSDGTAFADSQHVSLIISYPVYR